MSAQTTSLNASARPGGATVRGLLYGIAARFGSAVAGLLREVWALRHASAELRQHLMRRADECESTDPEEALRLRTIARARWSE